MEEKKEPAPPILEQLKEYAETRFKLLKYQAIESGSSLVAGIITDIVLVISALLAFLFASITLALFLGSVLQSWWGGFGCVTLLYIVVVLFIVYRKQSFEKPIINAVIKKVFKQS